jgi:hypothetical protein
MLLGTGCGEDTYTTTDSTLIMDGVPDGLLAPGTAIQAKASYWERTTTTTNHYLGESDYQ